MVIPHHQHSLPNPKPIVDFILNSIGYNLPINAQKIN